MNKPFQILPIEGMAKCNLEEVANRVKEINHKGGFIDSKIMPLVIGLNVWGIETDMSCEGHSDSEYAFPWVMIPWKYLGRAARILLEWNYRTGKKWQSQDDNTVIWVIETVVYPRIRTLPLSLSLEILQKDAVQFGSFLQNLPEDHDWTQ